MSAFELTKTRMRQGVWEAILTSKDGSDAIPSVNVTHLDQPVPDVKLKENPEAKHWQLRVPIPMDCIYDGVQVFLVSDAQSGETLGQFTLIAGEALGDDIRAETELLRAELDMLKRAFRRHCLETT